MANLLTLNHEAEASCYEEQLTANLVGKCRTEKLDGVEYLVAKIAALNPGVLNGSRGPLLYTPEDTRKAAKSWNDVPLVVYHPTDNEGRPISARAEGVVHVGFTKNAKYAGKLTVEGWFDVEKTKSTDSRVYDALVNGTPMEVSTGLGTTNEEAPVGSKYLGQLYTHIARNHRPDHLAILPDQRGACSLNDGCGLHVNKLNEELCTNCSADGECGACKKKRLKTVEEPVENEEELVDNELSHEDLRTRLMQLLNERYGTPLPSVFGVASPVNPSNLWINDVFDKDFVYLDGSEQYRLGYKTDPRNDAVTLSDEAPVRVTVKKSYVANEQREFLKTLNCGGKGGKPGPCPVGGGGSSFTAHGSPHLAGLESAMGVQFDPATAKTVGGRTSVIKRISGQGAKAAANRVREHLKSQGFSTYQGKTKTSTVHGHSDGTIIEVTASKRKPIKKDGKAIPGSGDSVLFQHITSGRRPTTNQLSKEVRKQTHNVGLKLVVNSLRKEADMAGKLSTEDREKLVDGLVENSGFVTADTWEEEDREVLNAMSDEKLYGLAVAKQTLIDQQSVVNAVGKHVGQHKLEDLPEAVENAFKPFKKKKVDDDEDEDMEDDEEEETTNMDSQIRVPRQLTEAEFMKMAPPSIRQDLEYSRAVQNKEKQELIGTITANVSGDELDQAVNYLRTKPLPELRIIANVASKPAAPEFDVNVRRSPNYGGMAVPTGNRPTTNKRPGEGPRPVTIPWGELSKQA